ncbi:MAG: hypothetical protein Q8N04_13405 [Nitrospira sp.]|nr:hypothetical protein [Nitrospira sp.]
MPTTILEIATRIAELEQQLERAVAEEVEAKRREFLDFGDVLPSNPEPGCVGLIPHSLICTWLRGERELLPTADRMTRRVSSAVFVLVALR